MKEPQQLFSIRVNSLGSFISVGQLLYIVNREVSSYYDFYVINHIGRTTDSYTRRSVYVTAVRFPDSAAAGWHTTADVVRCPGIVCGTSKDDRRANTDVSLCCGVRMWRVRAACGFLSFLVEWTAMLSF
jgi:hypothetical protein